jgi:hypothetical protein
VVYHEARDEILGLVREERAIALQQLARVLVFHVVREFFEIRQGYVMRSVRCHEPYSGK